MGEAGLFAHERVELLGGTIVTMSAQNSPHAGTVDLLRTALLSVVAAGIRVRAQLPIVLDDWSEPDPDVAVCSADPHHYTRNHPHAEQVLLVCEVASSSLAYDRSEKAAAYAASRIPEYWIVDIEHRIVHVLTDPDPGTRSYRSEKRAEVGSAVTAPGGATLAVADILPPPL
jgi:Uma2 family endonuclease